MQPTIHTVMAMSATLTILLAGCAFPPPSIPTSQQPPQVVEQPAQAEVALSAKAEAQVLLPTVTPEALTELGPTAEQQELLASLRNFGPAPELHNETWLNSAPLKLADLRGKVVMVEFWTFGCYNCKNMMPYVRQWHDEYADDGLVIIGVHTPEFSYEKEIENVKTGMEQQGVIWPVAIDNDWATWRSYNNRYWPAAYFIDKSGNVRLLKIGEGQYEYAERVIQALLAESLPS